MGALQGVVKEVGGIELKISADAEPTQDDLEEIRMKKGETSRLSRPSKTNPK